MIYSVTSKARPQFKLGNCKLRMKLLGAHKTSCVYWEFKLLNYKRLKKLLSAHKTIIDYYCRALHKTTPNYCRAPIKLVPIGADLIGVAGSGLM